MPRDDDEELVVVVKKAGRCGEVKASAEDASSATQQHIRSRLWFVFCCRGADILLKIAMVNVG